MKLNIFIVERNKEAEKYENMGIDPPGEMEKSLIVPFTFANEELVGYWVTPGKDHSGVREILVSLKDFSLRAPYEKDVCGELEDILVAKNHIFDKQWHQSL